MVKHNCASKKENITTGKKIKIYWSYAVICIIITVLISINSTSSLHASTPALSGYQNSDYRNNNQQNVSQKINPLQLQNIIKTKQSEKVRISRNQYDCFSNDNLQSFKNNKIPSQVVNELMMDKSFFDLVIVIKNMSANEQQELLETSSGIAKNTWATNGEVSAKGQTDAGREAELLIAKAIVSKVKELINLSEEEINKKRP